MPDQDSEELRSVVRGFLAKQCGEDEVRRLMETETGFDAAVWSQAAQELGLHGLAVPEELGGSGATPVELGVVFEEMGAALFGGPFLSTVGLAATALLEAGDDGALRTYLPGILDGRTIATLVWAGPDPVSSGLTAKEHAGGWVLSGLAPIVVDGASADLLLVAAATPEGPGLFVLTGDATGLGRRPLTALDSTRKLAEITFDGAAATPVGVPGEAAGPLACTVGLATLYLAAAPLGGATRVLATAVEYAFTRVQFGRPIGSFQAIKHRLADMLVEVESARSVVYHGLWTAVHDPGSLPVAASLARAVASDAYRTVASHNIQVHGGIGFTWEHSAHLYLKRAKSSQLLLGPPAQHRGRLAGLLGVTGDGVATTGAGEEPAGLPRTPEERSLQEEVAAFLASHPVPDPDDRAADRAFREARFDAGLAMVGFAEGHGGRGLDSALQPVVEEGFARAGAADHTARNVIGLGMALPTIHTHGTPAQKDRYLRPCFTGEEIWCQLFSEPGAGSDLAGLATRAVQDANGDFVVNGQKIWTSLGHVADFGIVLARTDPGVPKHKGLTYFLLDMRTEGVEVRPLRQLTGEDEFNEVYFTDVRIPADQVLGEIGQGWRVAMTTLANERISIGSRPGDRGTGPIARAVDVYRAAAADGRTDAATLEKLMQLWTQAEAARLTNVRAATQAGREPGPEGSIAKLQMAELNKAIFEFCVDLSGTDGLLIDGYTRSAPAETAVHGGRDVRKSYLRSLANSIEGGTSEVLRNILGERVLGLPGEPRVDRDVAWQDLRRS